MIFLATITESALWAAGGALGCFFALWLKDRATLRAGKAEAESAVQKARAEAEIIARDARLAASQEALKARDEFERSFAARRAEQVELERRLSEREALINTQLQRILEVEKSIEEEKRALHVEQDRLKGNAAEVAGLAAQYRDQLQKLAGVSQAEARAEFLKRVETESEGEAHELTRRITEEAKARAEDKARQIISVAIQRYAGEHTFETTTATVALQGDDMKGRIIGREGRNIRAFEAATGVTVLIDDTPGAVLLSGFDPVRREVAKEAMARLIQDGRIHPTRIEEIVEKVNQEMEETIMRVGEDAVTKAGVAPLHSEIIRTLGRLHFRHSYSQNILDHSVEVAHIMGLMAGELGLDIAVAKRCGLLHDIGKAVNHEIEGPHAVVGADLIKKYGEPDAVVNGVASHHNDVPPVGPWGILVSAADAISASRPGARSENMATYIKRIEDLERIATTFPGVEKAYAVQAGRELRVIVQPNHIGDEAAFGLARNIASKIENELTYPGQIKITVIRETRCVEVAK